MSFLSGFWDVIGTAVINVYGVGGGFLGSVSNVGFRPELVNLAGFGTIGFVTFNSLADPAGGDIDNLQFETVPEPASLLLLGAGLVMLARARLRKRA